MARHGENIHKRKDGRWEARIITGYDDHHKAVYKSLYGSTYEEVKKKKDNIISGNKAAPKINLTFDQAAFLWLADRKGKTKNTTYNHYLNQYELHIRSAFENRNISDLKAEDYNLFLKKKEEDGYSPRTLILLRTILKMILRYAEKYFDIPAVQDIYMPPKPRKQVEAFTRKEQSELHQYLVESLDSYSLSVLISLYCGLRIGEVCALQWKDINLEKGVITVSKTLIRVQTKGNPNQTEKTEVRIQKPKTESSSRKVPIPDFLKSLMIQNFHNDPECFIMTGNDHFMEPRVCLRKFKKIITSLGMEEYTFHACRHTYATRCVELGVDAKILAELMGHSSVKTTLDRYVHPSMDVKKEQINKLSQLSPETE